MSLDSILDRYDAMHDAVAATKHAHWRAMRAAWVREQIFEPGTRQLRAGPVTLDRYDAERLFRDLPILAALEAVE